MKRLASFVGGTWTEGTGATATLVNPATEEPVAETTTGGIDFAAALAHARDRGGPALRELSFAQRGQLLRKMAEAIHTIREELIALALENGGNTRGDAKFDIDGASFTLAHYADLAQTLGDGHLLADGDSVQIGRTARLCGQHVYAPRHGVAVQINAFNFPAWGLAEKAATALLAGMPVISKPATATSLVSHRIVKSFVDGAILPDGVLSFIAGGVGDLLGHLSGQDVVAFTGSSVTAKTLRSLDSVVERSVHINVEADSLNAAVFGPDADLTGETGQLFLVDVARDMTQKTGQKCTAIRRVFVPHDKLDDATAALSERLGDITVGNPATRGVRMGPVATAAQLRDVKDGIAMLAAQTESAFGGAGEIAAVGVPSGKGYFVGPVLRVARDAATATSVHQHEVFGPVATIMPYSGDPAEAARLVQLGAGGLVASVYSDDRDFFRGIVPAIAPYNGRLYLGSHKIAAQSAGPGTVVPHLCHGGPGRAGGGEELGGVRGMRLYMQRCALQGDKGVVRALLD